MNLEQFQNDILSGIPKAIPLKKEYDPSINHAPKRKEILSGEEKKLALKNALRYFDAKHHATLLYLHLRIQHLQVQDCPYLKP